ncbi:MAG TPA: hypothetical protein VL096_04980 [Pirellulaceae bacterium]|nr:hypothetical protein [Pirellulaceae bacterium]
MNLFTKLREMLLRKQPITTASRPGAQLSSAMQVDPVPAFHLGIADAMRFDPQVRIGLGARNGLLMGAEVRVSGGRREIARWVQSQWDRLWSSSAPQLLRTKLYGFLPFEVMYRVSEGGPYDGAIEFERLEDRHPRAARLLLREGLLAGFELVSHDRKPVRVLAPKALVCTFEAEFGNPYGCSLLERAYRSWYEKWTAGGCKKTLQLRMMKDAYIGDIIWYPPDRTVELAGGGTVSWRDLAREIVEARQTGGALALPLLYDRDGHRLVDYTPPQDVGGATQIFKWKHDIDLEIWKALEVPPEIIEASAPGSGYAGRSIPFMVALSAVQTELAELVRCVDRDVLRPLAQLNFGSVPQYEIRPLPLIETFGRKLRTRRDATTEGTVKPEFAV